MVMPIQSLMNMEMMLYGGYGMNTNAPSFYNNYTGRAFGDNTNNSLYNSYYPSFYGYNNTNFGQTIPSVYTQNAQQQTSNNAFAGLNDKDKAALVDNYVKGMSPSESFLGAAAGAAGFSVLFHPRAIAHPINTFKSFAETNKIFADVTKSGTNLAKAWADTGLNEVVRDAYTATNRIVARSHKGKGLHIWRKAFAEGEFEQLLNPMKEALKNLNPENEASVRALIKETERLNQANVKNGLLPRAWNGIKNIFRSEKQALPTALDASKNTKVIEEAADKAIKAGKAIELGKGKTYFETLKTSGGGVKGGLFFLAIEYLTSWSKIKACFKKDKKTGMKQLGQTTVKGIGSAAGWAAGEALGTWGCAKLCAAAGTAIAPGVGTAIGAVAGMIVGSIGCWLAGKITNKLVGQDVGDKIEAENMTKTEEGQAQLLQYTMEKMAKGEKVDPQAEAAVQKLMGQYA